MSLRYKSFLSARVREYAYAGLYSFASPGVETAQSLFTSWFWMPSYDVCMSCHEMRTLNVQTHNVDPSVTARDRSQFSSLVNAPPPVTWCIFFNLQVETPVNALHVLSHPSTSSLISAVAARNKCFHGEGTPREPL